VAKVSEIKQSSKPFVCVCETNVISTASSYISSDANIYPKRENFNNSIQGKIIWDEIHYCEKCKAEFKFLNSKVND